MNIVITGCSRGIGRALALKLAKTGHHNILGISRNSSRLNELSREINKPDLTSSFIAFPFELDKLEDLQTDFLQTISKHFSQVDILVNNAGFLVNKPFGSLLKEDIRKSLAVNFTAPLLVIRSLLPFLERGSSAHVVNIGTMGAVQGSAKFPGLSAYSSSKAALATLTEVLAEEFKEKNIHFNYLALGAVQTEMLEEAFPGYQAPLSAENMAEFITDFALNGWKYFNGKILPVAVTTP